MLETEEEIQTQRVAKVLAQNLRENDKWKQYINDNINPINELEKSKLCQDQETSKSNDTDDNIFDDDFIRSDFANLGG
jgi:hypothetical protein